MNEKANAKYHSLTLVDRQQIEYWIGNWRTSREIGGSLGYSHTSISREIKRNGGRKNYRAEDADLRARKLKIKRNS